MTTVNAGIHEVPGVRVPLHTSYGSPPHAVLMYSSVTGAAGEGVTLQLRDASDADDKSGLAGVLARLQQDDAGLNISYHDTEMLADPDPSIDVLLGTGHLHSTGTNGTSSFDLFDSDNGQDLTLSPETFTSSTEAFMNDNENSDSLGVPCDGDTVGSTDDIKGAADSSKLSVKKCRAKAASPNRQGPQQCQVCGKVFGNASALAKHKLTHSDERKYVCTMCGKAFKRQDHLNGHMLTHRNKKPYECKADGCGKSYCDARSLRRHTENHHTGSAGGAGCSSSSNSAHASAVSSGKASSTSGSGTSSCIQYAPPPASPASPTSTSSSSPASKPPSQLQQLLASHATSSSSSSSSSSKLHNNDGLTKQQLDLIHQIMQQTQQASQQKVLKLSVGAATSASTVSDASRSGLNAAKPALLAKPKSVTSPAATGIKSTGASSSHSGQSLTQAKHEPKPVECNLCHRKFKNIPALNGHMRLHGGYFKKDADKKSEKKEGSGPPLQTASLSVRALIEEKIIQKRSTSCFNGDSVSKLNESNNGNIGKSQVPGAMQKASNQHESDLNIKLSSFVVPAPPALSPMSSSDSARCHSDSEHFSCQDAQALTQLLIKRGKKLCVKRASSDPGGKMAAAPAPSSPLTLSASSSPPIHLSFHSSDYSLASVSYPSDDGGYFSPSLQEDVFQSVSAAADSMLLQGVDASQLAESLHFQASLLQDQGDNLSLEYEGDDNEELQAVLNSPLQSSLSDLGAYSSSNSSRLQSESESRNKHAVSYEASPLDSSKDLARYAHVSSPHPSLPSASPLPSPTAHHDSPTFAYPTPPASQEGQSPSFGQGIQADSFVHSVISHGTGPVPVSSPLSAAFYTTTMSSAAAVEEALSQVLPLDSHNTCSSSVRLGMYQASPSSHSPLSATASSPLSMSNVPISSSSAASPLPQNSFSSPQTHPFPMSPQQALQSQMMPNSEDPLLSSSPKDFASKKKFEFNGLHSLKLIGNGMVDLGNGSFGIVVDSNGEVKLFQTSNTHGKNLVVSSSGQSPRGLMLTSASSTQIPQHVKGVAMPVIPTSALPCKGYAVTASPTISQPKGLLVPSNTLLARPSVGTYVRKIETNVQPRTPGKLSPSTSLCLPSPANIAMRLQRIKLPVPLDSFKEEPTDDVFLSPRWTSTAPAIGSPCKPASLQHRSYHQSRLRAPRVKDGGCLLPYTAPPILSPTRPGQGLYCQRARTNTVTSCLWPTSTTTYGVHEGAESSETPPETSATPRVNIGPRYQAMVPATTGRVSSGDASHEQLLWDPGISKFCTDSEIDMYLEFSCCAAVPGGGRNKEYALHLLHMCQYNIHDAMLKLMQPTPWLPPGHPLLAYEYSESDKWSAEEVEIFHQGLLKFDKDFKTISQEIGSKTIKQCIQFYYLWKKICPEEYKRLRLVRRRKEVEPNVNYQSDLDFDEIKVESSRRCSPVSDSELVTTTSESRLFVCEFSDCSASFNSRAALSGHIRIHGGTAGATPGRASTPDRRDCLEEFPCKICGKIFSKVKSRSAHMKSHRPPDAENKKAKMEASAGSGAAAAAVSSSGISNKLG